MSDLQRHKKSDKIKWIFTGITFLLFFVMLTGVCLQVFGTGKLKPSEWFVKFKEQTKSEMFDNGGAFIADKVENGVQIVSSTVSLNTDNIEKSYKLTATLYPVTAKNKNINWSVAWKDGSSSWGKDKTVSDYVYLNSYTSLSGESVTLNCIKDFGEQIIITALSDFDSEIFAECKVDYIRKIKNLSYRFSYGSNHVIAVVDSENVYRVDYTGEAVSYTAEILPVYTNYTIIDNFSMNIKGSFTHEFGYTAPNSFSEISLQAGLFGVLPDSALSSDAINFIDSIDYICNDVGNFQAGIKFISEASKLYNALSFEEKESPKVINRKLALDKFIGKCNSAVDYSTARSEAITVINSYIAPSISYNFHGVAISEEALLIASEKCNNAKNGIQEYTITFKGEYSTFNFILKLGYSESSIQRVRGMSVSSPSVLF